MKRLGTFFIILSLKGGAVAWAGLECFEFQNLNEPSGILISEPASLESWCYASYHHQNRDYSLVFRKDAEARLELSVLVELDGQKVPNEFTHASMAKGVLSFHTVDDPDLNPLPVPLSLGEAKRQSTRRALVNESDIEYANEAFLTLRSQRTTPIGIRLTEGTFESYLGEDKYPFLAYWWPHYGIPLAAGQYSPLGKYDRFVESITGQNPDSVKWERQYHSLQAVPWGGHCNSWAASAVLYPEPTKYLWDPNSKKVIFPSDVEGMLAEASFCVDWAFYGKRYFGNTGDDLLDIYPDKFHKVLVYYIEGLKKPVALDEYRSESVNNHVFTGYKMTIQKDPNITNQYNVTAEMREHYYPYSRAEEIGKANYYEGTYSYTLQVDDSGNITGGTWNSHNPDFLWVPLAQKKCGRENPQVEHEYVSQLIDTLGEAKTKTNAIDFLIERSLAPSEEVVVPLDPLRGAFFKVHVSENTLGSQVYLSGEGFPIYPTTSSENGASDYSYVSSDSNSIVELSLQDLNSLKIVNGSSEPTPEGRLKLQMIEYLGGD